jgi:hypothetical protein
MFSKVQGIKRLYVNPNGSKINFPDVDWKLEQLTLEGYKFNLKSFRKFIKNQKSTLKVLKLENSPESINYIMKNLKNLEKLAITIDRTETIDKLPKHDTKLRSLKISQAYEFYGYDSDEDYESCTSNFCSVLSHYKNIKCLLIYSDNTIDLNLGQVLELNNLTHLFIHDSIESNLLFKCKMPNLKYISASYETFGVVRFDSSIESEQEPRESTSEDASAENLLNVEVLTIYNWQDGNILKTIEKFPNLKHLNLGSTQFLYEISSMSQVINDIAPIGSKLIILGTDVECLMDFRVTYEQLLSEVNNKRIFIKLYDTCKDMNVDYWDPADYKFTFKP